MSDADAGACPCNEWCAGTKPLKNSLEDRCPGCWERYADQVVRERKSVSQMSDVEAEFHRLLVIWDGETRFLSNLPKAFQHQAYQAIIALGMDAVPVILREMERMPNWLGHALGKITGEHPHFTEDMAGRLDLLTAAWLAWGRNKGYLK